MLERLTVVKRNQCVNQIHFCYQISVLYPPIHFVFTEATNQMVIGLHVVMDASLVLLCPIGSVSVLG